MTLGIYDRVKETTTTTGTGNIVLGGAQTGYQSFSSSVGAGNTTYYCIQNPGLTEWEVGLGTLSGTTTLQRTTILASSNGGSAVNFSPGTKDVFVTAPASQIPLLGSANTFSVALTAPLVDRGGQVYNVKAFGAKGDGVTDDTAAIESAIIAMSSGGILFFSPANYIVNGPINIAKSCVICGSGANATTLSRGNGSNYMFSINGSGTICTLRDLTLDGGSLHFGGISVTGIDTITLERLVVQNCGIPGFAAGNQGSVDGIHVSGAKNVRISGCTFQNCERDGVLCIPADVLTVTNSRFLNCGRYACADDTQGTGTGTGPVEVKYIGNRAESCGSGGFHIETDPNLTIGGYSQFIGNSIISCGNDQWGAGYYAITLGSKCYGVISDNIIKDFASALANGNIANGSNTITNVTNSAVFSVGMGITDFDGFIPAGTTITNISGTTLTISNTTTGVHNAARLYSSKTYTRSAISIGNNGSNIVMSGNYINNPGDYGIVINAVGFPVKVDGGSIISAGQDAINGYNTAQISLVGVDIQNPMRHGINLNLCSTFIIDGCRITGAATAVATSASGIILSTCSDGILSNTDATSANQLWGLSCGSSERDSITLQGFTVRNNTSAGGWVSMFGDATVGTGTGIRGGSSFRPNGLNNIKTMYGLQSPTSGTWNLGDRIINRSPASGGVEGWICVTAGTPGTWKTYGSIST